MIYQGTILASRFKRAAWGLRHVANYIIIFTISSLIFGFITGCKNRSLYKDNRIAMGTFIEVTSPSKEAAGIVFNEIKRIEDLLSKYKPDSEISRLNKTGQLIVSPDTLYIIKKSKEFWQASDGAFDITVAPLSDIWGFTDKKYILPQAEQIKDALERIGSDKIILNDENNMVKFKIPQMKIDLGGIAKGYALDCAVKKLKASGITSCLINTGGQVYCLGGRFGKPWRIAIKDPRYNGVKGYLELKDKSVSTSGDYEQYFIRDNKRYAHIFNPKTGYPADSGVISVTAVSSSGLTADALSTVIFVLGKEKGEALAKKFSDVEVKIIENRDGSQLKAKLSL